MNYFTLGAIVCLVFGITYAIRCFEHLDQLDKAIKNLDLPVPIYPEWKIDERREKTKIPEPREDFNVDMIYTITKEHGMAELSRTNYLGPDEVLIPLTRIKKNTLERMRNLDNVLMEDLL